VRAGKDNSDDANTMQTNIARVADYDQPHGAAHAAARTRRLYQNLMREGS
jgi:hypothetical protein